MKMSVCKLSYKNSILSVQAKQLKAVGARRITNTGRSESHWQIPQFENEQHYLVGIAN